MPAATVISIVALFVSVTSVAFTVYFGMRDRPRLKSRSTLYHPNPDDYSPFASVHVRVVNAGRRTVILRAIGGNFGRDRWTCEMIDSDKGGLRLGEHEAWERTFRYCADDYSFIYYSSEDTDPTEEVWVEDTLGRRHTVRGSKAHFAAFWRFVAEESARKRADKPAGGD